MQADNNSWDVLANDDEEDQTKSGYIESLKDVILFAVDCSPSMVAPQMDNTRKKGKHSNGDEQPSETRSHLFATLKAAVELQKRKAMYEPDHMVGILFFNVMEDEKKAKEKSNDEKIKLKPHIEVFQSISQVNAEIIQNILSILNDAENGVKTLEQVVRPWSRRVALGDVLSACNWLLRDQAPKAATKRVFLITDEDEPHGGSVQLDRIAKQNLADLYSLGVTIEPFFVTTPNKPFDVMKSYTEILARGTGLDDEVQAIPDVIEGFSRFLDTVAFRVAPKRSQFSIPLSLANGLTIGVKGYGMVVEQKKTLPKLFLDVDGELKELASKTSYIAEGVMDDQIKAPVVYGMSLGSTSGTEGGGDAAENAVVESNNQNQVSQYSQVYYTVDDVRRFRTLGMEPGIRLLGFKDADTLAFEDNIKHSYFLYPNDMLYQGSIRTFNALLRTMVTKNKIGLAIALFRRNSSPYFYAMVPQEETFDEDGRQEKPAGIHMIPLPYADDIRAAPVEEALRASEDVVQAAAAWVRKLKIGKGYDPDAYPNPTLNLFYSQLEAMALREDFNAEEFDDKTAPQTDLMLERVGPLVTKWKEALAEDPNANTYVMKTGTKRKADVSVDELEVREHYSSGTLSKMTVDMLKSFLKAKSLPITGKKADLLERVTAWLDKN